VADLERTLVLVKPDGVQRGLVAEILGRFERRGLKIVGLRLLQMSPELAGRHYEAHREKPFFGGLVEFITSGPLVAVALEGPRAIEIVRTTMGKTNPVDAPLGTIRGDLGIDIGRNLVHGSDSPENAARELEIFFRPDDLVSYGRATDGWIVE
jgi:nucleoside-diphosphate kinase